MTYHLVPYSAADLPTGGATTVEVSPAKAIMLVPADMKAWKQLSTPGALNALPDLPVGWRWLILPPNTAVLKLEEAP